MEYTIPQFEERYKKRSAAISMTIWLILLILLILPLFHYPTPPPGQEGIMVNLGMIDIGEGDENAAAAPAEIAEVAEAPAEVEEVIPEPEPIPEPEVVEAVPPPAEPEVVDPTPEPIAKPDPEILRQEQAAIALKKRAEVKAKADQDLAITKAKAKEAAADAQRKAQAEAERKAQAEAQRKAAEAQRVADAKAAAAAKASADAAKAKAIRDGMAGLFNGNDEGSGGGKGNTGTAGNQGDPNGDPNADRLTGIHTGGAGDVSGGLAGRGVLSSPKLSDNSQRKGRVVVKVCVGANGLVTSAKYTQLGSSTSDPVLQKLAVENAKNYRFSKSSTSSQCGNITYDFVVK